MKILSKDQMNCIHGGNYGGNPGVDSAASSGVDPGFAQAIAYLQFLYDMLLITAIEFENAVNALGGSMSDAKPKNSTVTS